MKKTKYKPLYVEDANPCMKCGSVQCAFCSEDLKSALEGLKKDLIYNMHEGFSYDEKFNKWFPVLKEIEK
jgi:hypothetical protein